jgi:alkyl sulfatase BDS1-like metallo-beta-lactamase superfamily hydrolase
VAPNCGNPQKVQRYPVEWAGVAEQMATVGAEHLLPGHNAYQRGADHIRRLFTDQARYLHAIVDQTLDGLNQGLPHDEVVAGVRVPDDLAGDPFLQPAYDRPEFIARNVVRRYGGWWDGYAADLLPAPMRTRAAFVARLAGGAAALAGEAEGLADDDLPLACHVAEWALLADPEDAEARRVAAGVFERRALAEPSVMARGIYRALARRAGA